MILNLNALPITILFPRHHREQIDTTISFLPFEASLIDQLSQLGHFLMSNGRAYPNIVAAGYWLRKSHLLSIKAEYSVSQLKAKGTVFHIAPGNVDTLFFYSMMISILCGNQTILRVSNEVSAEADVLLEILNQFEQTLEPTHSIFSLLTVIQYARDDIITAKISSVCDSRVIWGGDDSIEHICQFPLANNTANNICFPDRYSVAVIQIEDESKISDAVDKLLRDIKPYYQQACSSPKVVYWLNTLQRLQDKFWSLLDKRLSEQESLEPADLIVQMLYVQRLPLLLESGNFDKVKCLLKKHDLAQVLEVESITLDSIKLHSGLWVLLSLQINSLDDVELFDHCQTVSVLGIDKSQYENWKKTTQQPLKRIVPTGQALAFSHVWDGVDLVDSLVNSIDIALPY